MWTGLPGAVASPRRTHRYIGQARDAAERAAASLAHYLHETDGSLAMMQRRIAAQAAHIADNVSAELYACQLCASPAALAACKPACALMA